MQNTLTLDNVNLCKRQFQINKETREKVICAIIAQFNNQINVSTNKMDSSSILECANYLMEYTHDSIEDIVLAFKMAKSGMLGTIYNRLDTMVLMEFWKKYMDLKYQHLENEKKSEKSQYGDFRNEIDTLIISKERAKQSEIEKLKAQITHKNEHIANFKEQLDRMPIHAKNKALETV